MAFAVLAEGRAPGSGNARLLKEPGAESVAVDSKGSYAGKRVKGAARCAAGDAGNLIQRRDHPVPSLPESVPHPVGPVTAARAALCVNEAVQELKLTINSSTPFASSGCMIPYFICFLFLPFQCLYLTIKQKFQQLQRTAGNRFPDMV